MMFLLLSFPLESKPLDIQEVSVLFIAISPCPEQLLHIIGTQEILLYEEIKLQKEIK